MFISKDNFNTNFMLVILFFFFFPYKYFEHYAVKSLIIFFTPLFFLFYKNWKINKKDLFILFFIFANIISYLTNIRFEKLSIDYSLYRLLILLNIFFIYKIFDYLLIETKFSLDKIMNFVVVVLLIFVFLENIIGLLLHSFAWVNEDNILTYQLEKLNFEFFLNYSSAILNLSYIFPVSYFLLNWTELDEKKKIFILCYLLLVLLSLLLVFSRLSIFIFFLNIILIICINFIKFKRINFIAIIWPILFLLFLILLNYLFFEISIKNHVSHSIKHRIQLVENYLFLIKDFNLEELFFGKGIGWINHEYILNKKDHILGFSTHNLIISIFIETGFLGLFSMITLLSKLLLDVHSFKLIGKKKKIKIGFYLLFLNFIILNLFHSDLMRMLIPFSIMLIYYSITKNLYYQNIK